MSRVLVLGATGRAGSAICIELSTDVQVVAALRTADDVDRLADTPPRETALLDLADPASIRLASEGVDVVVNAVRLREDIAPDALVSLHENIRTAIADDVWVVTVGGAGALHLHDGRRFWPHPAFPATTLPRGVAHAHLRNHLESSSDTRWTYVIPPPAFDPDGPRTGRYESRDPSGDESVFARTGRISYADFALAAAQHTLDKTPGTVLIRGS